MPWYVDPKTTDKQLALETLRSHSNPSVDTKRCRACINAREALAKEE